MTQTTFKVSREFIVAGHKDACSAWKTKLETKFPEAFQTPAEAPTFKMGDRISGIDIDNNEYMLAQIDDESINLINLSNGNRWHKPVHVDSPRKITLAEFKQLGVSSPEIVVNGKTVSLKPVPKRVKQSFEVDAAFIREAASAASSEWSSKIKAEFPKVFDTGYLKLTDEHGHSMPFTISDVATAIQPTSGIDAQICIAKGYVQGSVNRPDLNERALCIEGDDVERVELIHEPVRGRWFIAIKTK
jgi:hypothetical protein